ncbi:MAG: lycopene cyclase domain-containing protein [Puniceicoccaceae bacterium]
MDSDIYRDWLPGNLYYLVHLVAWMGPVVVLQWLIGARILRRNLRAIVWPVLIAGTYLIATDVVAVHLGIWHFDQDLILAGLLANQPPGWASFLAKPFGVPVEEWLFFYLTALLCAQSFVLFLPERHRR